MLRSEGSSSAANDAGVTGLPPGSDDLSEAEWREAHAKFVGLVDDLAAGWVTAPEDMPARFIERHPELRDVKVRDDLVVGPHGPVPVRVYEPTSAARSTVMWIHGGAFVVGDLDMPEANWVSLVLASQGHYVVSVDYQKSRGDVHYPVPSDDVLAAWRWVAERNANDPVPGGVHLGGGSAGGAFAAALAVRIRDAGEPMPASLTLVYPVVHPRLPPLSTELQTAIDTIPGEHKVNLIFFDGMHFAFAGSMEALADPHAFAGLADLTGLPPTLVLNSERDFLRASGERFAQQLADAGVAVECVTETGSLHGQLNEPSNPFGVRSLERVSAWLDRQVTAIAATSTLT
jgi:acetyl esterase